MFDELKDIEFIYFIPVLLIFSIPILWWVTSYFYVKSFWNFEIVFLDHIEKISDLVWKWTVYKDVWWKIILKLNKSIFIKKIKIQYGFYSRRWKASQSFYTNHKDIEINKRYDWDDILEQDFIITPKELKEWMKRIYDRRAFWWLRVNSLRVFGNIERIDIKLTFDIEWINFSKEIYLKIPRWELREILEEGKK